MAINVLGAGAVIQLLSGSYITQANILSIGGPGVEVDDVNTSNLSTTNLFKTWIAGWKDAGTCELEANFDPATFAALFAATAVSNTWRIIFSNGSKWDFTGYLKSIKTDNPLEGLVTMPIAIKVSGQPTFTQ